MKILKKYGFGIVPVFTTIFTGMFLLAQLTSMAQGLTARTNQYLFDLKNNVALPSTGPLPEIKWIKPQLEFGNSVMNNVEVKASIKSTKPIKGIRLSILNNADPSRTASKSFPVQEGTLQYEIESKLSLLDGTNIITLEVTTADNIVVSDFRQILVGKDEVENMVSLNRKDYILIFATDKYDHWDDLVNPLNDARAISNELRSNYGFEVELVQNPTVEQIWEKLREYNERKFAPQDQLMIFFAGHGHFDESFGEGYVVAKNSLSNDVSKTTYISHNRLRGVINNIGCNHILLAMDVCFGGTLDPVIARSRGAVKENEVSTSQLLARKWSHRTRKYLTSGGKEYVSDGVADKHSPFAAKLIESLKSYGGDDNVLTLAELQANLEKMAQLPRFGSFGHDEPLSDFVFVRKR